MKSRFPTTLTILPTYNCTAACENCCFGSHPGIKERIPLERILDYIEQAAAMKTVRLVVFSGGECFSLGDELVIAVARATELGLSTRCVSNGFWATSKERADELLDRLARAGLDELNLSTGDYHQAYVTPAKVVTAAIAGVKAKIRIVVVVESRQGRGFTMEHLLSDSRVREIVGSPLFKVIESPWMSMHERSDVQHDRTRLTSRLNLHLKRGCDSVLNTIVVTPSEHLGACCGLSREHISEMNAGSLRDATMRELYDYAANDLLKMWIAVDGPERILAWAAEKDASIEWEYRYNHHCEACRALYEDPRVRKVIRMYYHEKRDDVVFRFFLLGSPGLPSNISANDSYEIHKEQLCKTIK